MIVQTTVNGRFPYSHQPPPHLIAFASHFNISVGPSSTFGFEECVTDEAILCPAGTHHDPAVAITFLPEQCLGCPAGTYCPHGAPQPTLCAPGSYGAQPNASACELCAAGSYQSGDGATSCDTCTPGFYCPLGSSSPVACPAGTYQPAPSAANATACLPTLPGTFATGGSAALAICMPGSYSIAANTTACELCPPGTFQGTGGASECVACGPGYYCPRGSTTPTPCPPGTWQSETAAANVSECLPVPAGFFARLASAEPIACPSVVATYDCPGTLNDTNRSINAIPGSAPIETLLPQWIQDLVYKDNLVLGCPTGQEAIGSGCAPCRKGHYCIGGTAVKCEEGTWHNKTGQSSNSSCALCPKPGTRCITGDELEVLPGYFMLGPAADAYKCASSFACSGGPLTFGDDSCRDGHTGVICGECVPGYYRGRGKCLSCADLSADEEDIASTKTATLLAMAGTAMTVFFLIFVYLFPPGSLGRLAGRLAERLKPILERHHLDLSVWQAHLVPVTSGIFKVLLSYIQCVGAITRFNQVRWPLIFTRFLDSLMELIPELLTLLPAECVAGTRLGFVVELATTMMLPVFITFYILLVVLFIRFITLCLKTTSPGIFADPYGRDPMQVYRSLRADPDMDGGSIPPDLRPYYASLTFGRALRRSVRYAFFHPKLVNTLIFGMLFLYPMLCRKSMATFDCVEAGVDGDGVPIYLLRDDPVVRCRDSYWFILAIFAGNGILFYGLGVPYGAFVLARNHRRETLRLEKEEKLRLELRAVARVSRKKQSAGSAFIARLYQPKFWYVEPIALLHNFFFTGVIHIIEPETRIQIWAGVFASLISFTAFILARPYKYFICTAIQSAALLQILLTYITAFLFFRDPTLSDDALTAVEHTDTMGVVLVGLNTGCFLVLVIGTVAVIYAQQKNHAMGQLRVQYRGKASNKEGSSPAEALKNKGGEGEGGGKAPRKKRAVEKEDKVGKEQLVFAKQHLHTREGDNGADGHDDHPLGLGKLKWHLFLSHVWSSAQDQMRFVKTRMVSLIPDVKVFLDVDDLTEGFGAEAVLESVQVLVFVSDGYFESKNCMRELLMAVLCQREMITVLELDLKRWKSLSSTSAKGELLSILQQEIYTKLLEIEEERVEGWFASEQWYKDANKSQLRARRIFDELFRFPPIEWNRLTDFQNETIRLIAVRLLKPMYRPEAGYVAYVPGSTSSVPELPPPRDGRAFHLFCSNANPTAFGLRDELNGLILKQRSERKKRGASDRSAGSSSAGGNGKRQLMTSMLKSTLSASEEKEQQQQKKEPRDGSSLPPSSTDTLQAMKTSEAMLLHLTAETWADEDRSKRLASDLIDAMRCRLRILLAHEMPGVEDSKRKATPFDIFFSETDGKSYTPRFLKDAGLYSTIAVPLKGGVFRDISLGLLLREIAGAPREGMPNPFQSDEDLGKAAATYVSGVSNAAQAAATVKKRRLKAAGQMVLAGKLGGRLLTLKNWSSTLKGVGGDEEAKKAGGGGGEHHDAVPDEEEEVARSDEDDAAVDPNLFMPPVPPSSLGRRFGRGGPA